MKYLACIFVLLFVYDVFAHRYKTTDTYLKFKKIEMAIEAYKKDCKIEKLGKGFKLKYLVSSEEPCWLGPYMKEKERRDPFGQEIIYVPTAKSYQLISSGKDHIFNTSDDLRNSDSSNQARKQFCSYKSQSWLAFHTCIYARQLLFVYLFIGIGIIFFSYKIIRKLIASHPKPS